MRYHMIERCRDAFPVLMMCRCLKVSPSGFYDWAQRQPSAREQDNRRLLNKICFIHAESDGVFGSPRIYDELRYSGETCGRHRVARLMKAADIKGIPARKKWKMRPSGERPEGVQNILSRDFTAEEADTKWVTDITYIRTGEGWLYLAVVLDLYTRQIIGWSMSHVMDKHLVIQSVLMALWQRKDKQAVVLHSDRGSQYTSHEYQQFLKAHGVVSSMSAVGSCYDNAAAESFFGLLKRERVNRRRYTTRAEARSDVFDYIERFYNRRKQREIENDKLQLNTLN